MGGGWEMLGEARRGFERLGEDGRGWMKLEAKGGFVRLVDMSGYNNKFLSEAVIA